MTLLTTTCSRRLWSISPLTAAAAGLGVNIYRRQLTCLRTGSVLDSVARLARVLTVKTWSLLLFVSTLTRCRISRFQLTCDEHIELTYVQNTQLTCDENIQPCLVMSCCYCLWCCLYCSVLVELCFGDCIRWVVSGCWHCDLSYRSTS